MEWLITGSITGGRAPLITITDGTNIATISWCQSNGTMYFLDSTGNSENPAFYPGDSLIAHRELDVYQRHEAGE